MGRNDTVHPGDFNGSDEADEAFGNSLHSALCRLPNRGWCASPQRRPHDTPFLPHASNTAVKRARRTQHTAHASLPQAMHCMCWGGSQVCATHPPPPIHTTGTTLPLLLPRAGPICVHRSNRSFLRPHVLHTAPSESLQVI